MRYFDVVNPYAGVFYNTTVENFGTKRNFAVSGYTASKLKLVADAGYAMKNIGNVVLDNVIVPNTAWTLEFAVNDGHWYVVTPSNDAIVSFQDNILKITTVDDTYIYDTNVSLDTFGNVYVIRKIGNQIDITLNGQQVVAPVAVKSLNNQVIKLTLQNIANTSLHFASFFDKALTNEEIENHLKMLNRKMPVVEVIENMFALTDSTPAQNITPNYQVKENMVAYWDFIDQQVTKIQIPAGASDVVIPMDAVRARCNKNAEISVFGRQETNLFSNPDFDASSFGMLRKNYAITPYGTDYTLLVRTNLAIPAKIGGRVVTTSAPVTLVDKTTSSVAGIAAQAKITGTASVVVEWYQGSTLLETFSNEATNDIASVVAPRTTNADAYLAKIVPSEECTFEQVCVEVANGIMPPFWGDDGLIDMNLMTKWSGAVDESTSQAYGIPTAKGVANCISWEMPNGRGLKTTGTVGAETNAANVPTPAGTYYVSAKIKIYGSNQSYMRLRQDTTIFGDGEALFDGMQAIVGPIDLPQNNTIIVLGYMGGVVGDVAVFEDLILERGQINEYFDEGVPGLEFRRTSTGLELWGGVLDGYEYVYNGAYVYGPKNITLANGQSAWAKIHSPTGGNVTLNIGAESRQMDIAPNDIVEISNIAESPGQVSIDVDSGTYVFKSATVLDGSRRADYLGKYSIGYSNGAGVIEDPAGEPYTFNVLANQEFPIGYSSININIAAEAEIVCKYSDVLPALAADLVLTDAGTIDKTPAVSSGGFSVKPKDNYNVACMLVKPNSINIPSNTIYSNGISGSPVLGEWSFVVFTVGSNIDISLNGEISFFALFKGELDETIANNLYSWQYEYPKASVGKETISLSDSDALVIQEDWVIQSG